MAKELISLTAGIVPVELGFRKGPSLDNPKKPSAGWGARIFEARAAMKGKRGKPMTQRQLGDAIGVSDSQIGWYEQEVNVPSQEGWLAIAEATATNFDWLVYARGPRDGAFTIPYEPEARPRPKPRKRKRGRG